MTKPSFKRIFTALALFFATIAGIIFIAASLIVIRYEMENQFFSLFDEFDEGYLEDSSNTYPEDEDYQEQSYCSIMGVMLTGELTTYDISSELAEGELVPDTTSADYITWAIKDAEMTEGVSAIILEVDSYGGSGVAGEEIATALKTAKKPTVVVIRDVAASAAYWASTGADYIVASAVSDIGGIGVTLSYLDYSQKNQKDGITYIELNSAKYKDAGDPNRPLTTEEKDYFQRDLDIMHNYFVKAVAENRKLDIEKVKQLADGSTMLGQMALNNGLIDKIGGQAEAIQYFIDKGVITEPQEVCWY
ncbi:MAG: signal peptide peptidase SppA [bacterium]|nr:signal peptide peptidase SppA [bacterium]